MCVVNQTEQAAAKAAFDEQPLFLGVESGDLIYLSEDGLYAFVAHPEAVVVAWGAEPEMGPHAFASATRCIRVEGIHARRLRDAAPLERWVSTRTRDGEANPEQVLAEWMDFCDQVADAARGRGGPDDDVADYFAALVEEKAKTWAVTDRAALDRARLAAAKEELVVAASAAAESVHDLGTLMRMRSMVLGMAGTAGGRGLAVA